MGMVKGQRRMTPPRNSPSAGVSGAALNLATARMEIPAQEIIIPQTVPKTTPLQQDSAQEDGEPALMRERQTKR